MAALKECSNDELEDIGLNMGQRKRIMKEVTKLKTTVEASEAPPPPPTSSKSPLSKQVPVAPVDGTEDPQNRGEEVDGVEVVDTDEAVDDKELMEIEDDIPAKINFIPSKTLAPFLKEYFTEDKERCVQTLMVKPRGNGKDLLMLVTAKFNKQVEKVRADCATPSDVHVDGMWLLIEEVTGATLTSVSTKDGLHISDEDIIYDLFPPRVFKGKIEADNTPISFNVEFNIEFKLQDYNFTSTLEKDNVGFLGMSWENKTFTFTADLDANTDPKLSWNSDSGGRKVYTVTDAKTYNNRGNESGFWFSTSERGEKRTNINVRGQHAHKMAGYFALHQRAVNLITRTECVESPVVPREIVRMSASGSRATTFTTLIRSTMSMSSLC